ncbi:glycoside hydrolase superfamily [Geopyxis carbonaria]|nr:glycoside hydrolase superfamily [Geopyxis carbonaria]
MQRSFSFQVHDDDPSYHPLAPSEHYDAPPPPAHRSSWDRQQQQQQRPMEHHQEQPYNPPEQHQTYNQPEHTLPTVPRRMDSSDSSVSSFSYQERPNRNSGTVLRKPLDPASAAAAAAALGPVRDGLKSPSPPPVPAHYAAAMNDHGNTPTNATQEDSRYWGQNIGYERSVASTPTLAPNNGPGTPGSGHYPQSVGTPSSQAPLLAGAAAGGPPRPPQHGWGSTGPTGSAERVYNDPVAGHYTDNPYKRASTTWDPMLANGPFDSHDILSDGEDDEEYRRRGPAPLAAGAAGIGAGGAAAAASAAIGASAQSGAGHLRGGAGQMESGNLLRQDGARGEKSAFLAEEAKRNKKTKWIVGLVLVFLILAIAGGTAAGVIVSRNKNNNGGGSSAASSDQAAGGGSINIDAAQDAKLNGDLDKNSPEIIKLMDNPKLHKVFHGIDYTPLNGVYPECLKWVPSQNNITRDIAVMSKLTDKIRLYGNDCNQTQMVLHAIDRLEVDMKIWIGVWLDGNTTTNDRQIKQLHEILKDSAHHDKLAGVAVGNEVLFSKYLTETQLFDIVDEVRSDLKSKGMNIPVGTSDLGSNWNSNMASKVDVLMANVHPFFAGVTVEKAADWTWDFFQTEDVSTTTGLADPPRVMISEVGWPSGGGRDNGSVAGIPQMNRFMQDFVCTENKRKTEYFWFSAFDEPWKMKYNQPELGKEWEDKWGLMDVNRKLKPGLEIPTCD